MRLVLFAAALALWSAPAFAQEGDLPAPGPVAIEARADEVGPLLEGAGWVHAGEARGPALYVVGFRSCPTCLALKAGEFARLEAAGVDIRAIVYARADRDGKPRSKPAERAMVAELWATRSADLYRAWHAMEPDVYYETETLPPPADGDAERTALVEKGRALVKTLDEICAANGVEMAVPALFWREDGRWFVSIGYDEAAFPATFARIAGR